MNLKQHRAYSKGEFEATLRKISPIKEFPEQWYEVDWVEDRAEWKRKKVNIKEICYMVPLTFNPVRLLKIYSTVDHATGWSRPAKTDAIRIVLADSRGEPKHSRFTRINRTGNWRNNLRKRIAEVLLAGGLTDRCSICSDLVFLWTNSKTGKRFLKCSNKKCGFSPRKSWP